jgi:Tfp pilus assembly protein PilV
MARIGKMLSRWSEVRTLGRREGLTLVETIIAILIFAICISGICKLVVITRESSDRARSHYTAINLGKNRLERAKVFPFGQLNDFVENQTVVDGAGTPSANGEFRRTTTVSNVTATLKDVTVRLEIRNRVTRRFEGVSEAIQTYIADFRIGGQ